ncbi:MAG TPA: ectonucleotide pyrophosphatase/phosphodiesterase [Vicinamibacterales bacterium]|nr:ectonucleotide pyrophosphatase/phosphodiesterase [Vicinamibacterales bacterium]
MRRLGRLWVVLVALALAACGGAPGTRAQGSRVPVVLVSIDGLKPDYVLEADRHGMKVPNLRRLVADGAYATGVTGVTPTLTYPSHTTLVTGVWPAEHGILNNTPFDPLNTNNGGWYWYAEDIKVPTLWDAAGEAGLVTANVDWPVTVGARIRHSIVQYWRAPVPEPPGGDEDHKLLRALSTPGLLDEAERDLGRYPAGYRYTPPDDAKRASFVAWMIEKKRPDFLTGYFSSLDEAQHDHGPYDKTTFATIEALDGLVGQVRAAAERAYGTRFVLAVVSDHGHIRTDRAVHVNAALQRAGLIDVDAKGTITAWRAYAWTAGGSAAVVLKEPNDDTTRAKAKAALQQLAADPAGAVDRILDGADLKASGGFPSVAFVVGLKPGFRTGAAMSGALITTVASPGGTHGYLPGPRDMESSFYIIGEGIPAGRNLGGIDMRDIAPTLASRLGVSLPRAQGRNLLN